MADNKYKKWFRNTLLSAIGVLLFITVAMVYVDPYFHFHKPLENLSYRLYSERYMNSGIAKNFEYDALITGKTNCDGFSNSLALLYRLANIENAEKIYIFFPF